MQVLKYLGIFLIFTISSLIGKIYSKRYASRVKDLEEMKKALLMFKSNIRFTYESIPEVFKKISHELKQNIGNIFENASKYMESDIASKAWKISLDENKTNTNMLESDVEALKSLSKMLGDMDLEGQINNIDLVIEMLNNQIEEAKIEQGKNEKMYKVLGTGIGLTIAIILI